MSFLHQAIVIFLNKTTYAPNLLMRELTQILNLIINISITQQDMFLYLYFYNITENSET